MTAIEKPSPEHLELALKSRVDALIEHRDSRSPGNREGFGHLMVVADMKPSVMRARSIVRDPMSYALRQGIKGIGQAVYDLYGMRELKAMAERVCDAIPGGFETRIVPVAIALDGVGSGEDRWWY